MRYCWKSNSGAAGCCLALIAALTIAPAHAEVFLDKYQVVKDTAWFKQYLGGVGTGFFWANIQLRTRKLPQFYCQPGKLAMYDENYLQVLDNYIMNRLGTLHDKSPIEELLLRALAETFPCE